MGAACCKPEHEKGPKALGDRGCTDIICLLIFLVTVGGVMGLGIWALTTGNIDPIIYPADYNGNYCGKSGTATADLPYAFFPRLDQDIIAQAPVIAAGYWWDFVPYTLCVAACPSAFSFTENTQYGGSDYVGVGSGESAPESFYSGFETTAMLSRCFPITETESGGTRSLCGLPSCTDLGKTCTTIAAQPDVDTVWEITTDDEEALCERTVTETTAVAFAPADRTDETSVLTQEFAEYVTFAFQFTRALDEAIPEMVVCGIVGPIVMGFAWVVFLWLFAGVIVVLALVLLMALLLSVTIVCFVKSGWASNLESYLNSTSAEIQVSAYTSAGSEDEETAYKAAAIIMTVITLLVAIMLMIWRKCIQRCIAIIRESTKVFRTIPSLIIWPIITITFLSLTLVWGIIIPFYIFYGDVESYYDNYLEVVEAVAAATNASADASDYLSDETAMQWVLFFIHLFGVLWMLEFVRACAWITMSGAVCYWYFFRENEEHKEKYPVLNAARRVLRFHLGSAAFGAFVIAVCQLIRYILATIDYYTKDLQDANFLYKMCIKCAQCGMWCLQKTIEFVSYYGFIFTALEGSSFCVSCKNTFAFLLTPKNAAQAAVNKTVEKIIVLIISWTTPTLLALVCYAALDQEEEYTDENNPLYPAIVVWIGAFFLSEAIATVFECTIDTIFLCSFKDAAEYEGKFMSADMREAFGLDVAEQEAVPVQTAAATKEVMGEKSSKKGASTTTGDGPTIQM